jgi:DNA-binding CsgD family transcriptional regulator/tetratricopeptide (TPR) repeat protein
VSGGLIGRESESATLRALVAPGGPPRFVLVEGEAGIGKTSLVEAVVGAGPVRRTQGVEEGGPPFWAWRGLTPEVRPDEAADRFALVAAIREVLAEGALLVLDDVQWADEASLRVLRQLLRDPECRGLVCVATRRTGAAGEGWARVGADLLAGPRVERVALGGLSDESAALLLRESGCAPGEVDAAVRAGGGNPLYLRELARLPPGERSWGSLGEIIAARVRRVAPPAQRLLRAASLLAEDFELAVAARLLDEPVLACLPAVTEATAAGLLRDGGDGRFRFHHGLVRTVLAAQTPLQEAVVLHGRAAEALEDLHRADLARVSADIARHRAAVAVTGDRAPAVAWARRAAEDARRELAYEDAARLYTSALTCGGATLAVLERGRLLLARAGAQLAAGRFAAALQDSREAVALAPELAAEAALTCEATGNHDWDRTVRDWCTQALAGTVEPVPRARLLARLAECVFYLGDVAGSAAPATEALALVAPDPSAPEPDGAAEALVAALRARQLTWTGPEFSAERAGLAARMTALGERLGRPDVEMWGRLWAIDVHWERGELAEIESVLPRLRWCVERRRSPVAGWHLLTTRAALAQARGELPTALALGDEAFRLVGGAEHPAAAGGRHSLLGAIGHHLGYPPEAAVIDDVDLGDVRANLFLRLGPATILLETGRPDEAAHLYRLTGRPWEWEVPPYFAVLARSVGATLAARLGPREDVEFFRSALLPHRDMHVVASAGTASYLGPVDLPLGRCAAALDDLDAAADHLTRALATCERIGAPGFAVESACELAEVRRRQGRDPAPLLARARPSAERLGMRPWTERIDGLLGGRSGPLTAREEEVAALVAQGLSNREIAARLVLSERTVGNHVQHILTKLGVPNRGRVAAWMSSRLSSSPDVPRSGSA